MNAKFSQPALDQMILPVHVTRLEHMVIVTGLGEDLGVLELELMFWFKLVHCHY
jgi:hypothetical protein